MGYQTTEDILEKWTNSPEFRAKERQINDIRKDVLTAQNAISGSIARYKKSKLKVRSKKAAQEDPFADLKDYESKQDIQDAFGWGLITEHKMNQLQELWDLREESKQHSDDNSFHDRVTELLEEAMRNVGKELMEQVYDYEEDCRKMRQSAAQIASENNERSWKREHQQEI